MQDKLSLRLRQFGDLLRIFLADLRDHWQYQVIFSLFLPLGFLYFIKFIVSGTPGPEQAAYFISGNVITSVVFGTGTYLIGRLGWGRQNRHFDYWASLPISKLSVILAIVTVNVLFGLPGTIGMLVLGAALFHFALGSTGLLVVALLLAVLAVAAMGAFLGTYAKDGPSSNVLGNVLVLVVTFLSPVMVPADKLGPWVKYTSALLPTSYAARAMREALLGQSGSAWVDLAILTVMTLALLGLVQWKLDWRGEA